MEEKIIITKEDYEKLVKEVELLRRIVKHKESDVDLDLVRQFNESLEDLKKGRFKRFA